jgi:hypothetical protein
MNKTISEILDNLVGCLAKMGDRPDYAEMVEYLDIKNISEIEIDVMGGMMTIITNCMGSALAKEIEKRIEAKKRALN